MDLEQEVRLTEQVRLSEEAEMALGFCRVLFPELRAEIYRELESESEPDLAALRARLVALRSVEERLAAYIRSGKLALLELTRGR
jgi:hypothetical protein